MGMMLRKLIMKR